MNWDHWVLMVPLIFRTLRYCDLETVTICALTMEVVCTVSRFLFLSFFLFSYLGISLNILCFSLGDRGIPETTNAASSVKLISNQLICIVSIISEAARLQYLIRPVFINQYVRLTPEGMSVQVVK